MKLINEWWNIQAVRRAVISLIVVLVVLIIYLITKRIWKKYRKKHDDLDAKMRPTNTMQFVVYDTIKVAVFVVLVLAILQINGVNVTSLVAGVGVVSAVIGLALQDFLKDIIMGVHIMMDDFFQIGDLVQFDDDEGTIEAFNLRTTKIRSIGSGHLRTICNRNIDKIIKCGDEIYLHLPIPYDTPSGQVVKVLTDITEQVTKNDGIVSCTLLGLNAFDKSSVDYLIKLVLEDNKQKLRIRREALAAFREGLTEAGIGIPFDQLDVHMK